MEYEFTMIPYTRYMGDLIDAIQTLNLVDPVQPAVPDPANLPAFEAWKYEFKEHEIKLQEYNNSRAGLYTLVLGQCMDAIQSHIVISWQQIVTVLHN